MKREYVIGVDLALANTGVAIIHRHEVISVHTVKTEKSKKKGKASDDLIQRCSSLLSGLKECIESYPLDKVTVAVEVPTGSKSAAAMKSLAAATGVLASLEVILPEVEFIHLTPHDIKKLVGSPEVKREARKGLNIAKAIELYPSAPVKRNKQGSVLVNQEHVCDAILLAHITSINKKTTDN